MTFTPYSRDLSQLLETVQACLLARCIPPDPISVVEYKAFVREFPDEAYRWQPPVEDGVYHFGDPRPPFSEEWDDRYTSTVMKDPARHGRMFAHAINVANQERSHE